MTSWKTFSAGCMAIVGGLCTLGFSLKNGTFSEGTVTAAATAILTGIGLIYARDNDVSSVDVGIQTVTKVNGTAVVHPVGPQASTSLANRFGTARAFTALLIALGATAGIFATLVFTSCQTTPKPAYDPHPKATPAPIVARPCPTCPKHTPAITPLGTPIHAPTPATTPLGTPYRDPTPSFTTHPTPTPPTHQPPITPFPDGTPYQDDK